jgi:hypothetical protein
MMMAFDEKWFDQRVLIGNSGLEDLDLVDVYVK